MMKLILSLTLIWTLSSTAEAVKCWLGVGANIKQDSCDSDELCATVAFQGTLFEKFSRNHARMCLPSSIFSVGQHTFSNNLGFEARSASIHVCNTYGCNKQDIPYPGDQMENNLTCFTCDNPFSAVCNKAIKCVGEQNRCINGTRVDKDGKTFHTFGCVTENLCGVVPVLKLTSPPIKESKFISEPKCCGSSFCNSAWSVKLNVIPLLFGLITLIVY